jgi:hypothetical protein
MPAPAVKVRQNIFDVYDEQYVFHWCGNYPRSVSDGGALLAERLLGVNLKSTAWGCIFSRVQTFYEWAVSDLDP